MTNENSVTGSIARRGACGWRGTAAALLVMLPVAMQPTAQAPAAAPLVQADLEGTYTGQFWETCVTYAMNACPGGLTAFDPYIIVGGVVSSAPAGATNYRWLCPGKYFLVSEIRINATGGIQAAGKTYEDPEREVTGGQMTLNNGITGELTDASCNITLRTPSTGVISTITIQAENTECAGPGAPVPDSVIGTLSVIGNAIEVGTLNRISLWWTNTATQEAGLAQLVRIGKDSSGPDSPTSGCFLASAR